MGSEGHLYTDAMTFAEWEVDMLKMDGCNSEVLDQSDGYPAMTRFLNETGRQILYACSWPCYDQSMDYALLPPNCNMWRNWWDVRSTWPNIRRIMDKWGNETRWAKYAGPGHWNDADMIVVGMKGTEMNEEESKTQFAIWSMLGSPLFMSNDLRELPEWARRILTNKEIIQIDQAPLGRVATRLTPFGEDGVIWSRPLANGDVAVALMNRGDEVRDIVLPFKLLGSGRVYAARDLYLHEDLGEFTDEFVGKKIAPHGTVILRMTPLK